MRGLDWSDERYVRLYRTDTADWLALSWHARGLYALLRRISDRAGLIRIGRTGRRGLAALVHASHDAPAVLVALDELERDGWVEFAETGSTGDPCLILPEFLESEEARTSDAARQRSKRERERDKARASVVQYPTQGRHVGESHAVTEGRHVGASHNGVTPVVTQGRHVGASHAVTEGRHSVPSVPSPDPDLTHDVVVAIPSIARVVTHDDDVTRDGRDSQPDPTPAPSTARSVPTPPREATTSEQNRPDVASAPMARPNPSPEIRPALKRHAGPEPLTAQPTRPRKPNFQTQYVPGKPGLAIVDPDTGREMVLDLAALSPEEVTQRREHGLAKMREAAEALATSSPPPASPRPPPPPPKPSPLPAMLDGEPEQVMRELLAKAPHPINLLAERSAARFASGLVGGQLRVSDVAPAFVAAATKLDPRFSALTAESDGQDLEALHRFVAGYLGRAPGLRRGQSQAQPTRTTEVGEKFLEFFIATYRTEKGHDYATGDDDATHAEAIGQAIERALATTPQDKLKATRRKYALRLVNGWLADKFAERCGSSLKQLARIIADEPNRFRFTEEPKRAVTGASQLPAEAEPAAFKQPTPEEFEEFAAKMRALGSGPKGELCPT